MLQLRPDFAMLLWLVQLVVIWRQGPQRRTALAKISLLSIPVSGLRVRIVGGTWEVSPGKRTE
jgi:hypothetical protein